jgi:hypothetical protein
MGKAITAERESPAGQNVGIQTISVSLLHQMKRRYYLWENVLTVCDSTYGFFIFLFNLIFKEGKV